MEGESACQKWIIYSINATTVIIWAAVDRCYAQLFAGAFVLVCECVCSLVLVVNGVY